MRESLPKVAIGLSAGAGDSWAPAARSLPAPRGQNVSLQDIPRSAGSCQGEARREERRGPA